MALTAFYDRQQGESISTAETVDVLAAVQHQFTGEPIAVSDCFFEKGEVLTDSRGRGSFQLLNVPDGR